MSISTQAPPPPRHGPLVSLNTRRGCHGCGHESVRVGTRAGQVLDPALLEEEYGVRNYHPLPVVITRGEGSWVEDVDGRRYFDALSAYSALNFGHRHPRLVAAAHEQLDRLTLTSRAFRNDRLGEFCRRLAEACSMQRVLPMNTGAEAVETAIKAARKWGYEVKGVEPDRAKIVVCRGNFHGRTTTIVSFSDDPTARDRTSGPTRRASRPSRSATSRRSRRRSTTTRWRSWSSRSRARPA